MITDPIETLLDVGATIQGGDPDTSTDVESAHDHIMVAVHLLRRQTWRDGVNLLLRELPDFDREPMSRESFQVGAFQAFPGSWYYEEREGAVNLLIGAKTEQHAGLILEKLSDAGLLSGFCFGDNDQWIGATEIESPYGWIGFRVSHP